MKTGDISEQIHESEEFRGLAAVYHRDLTEAEVRIRRAGLYHVVKLDLGMLQLTSLPESLGRLPQLTQLYLHNNQLTSLPESLGNLVRLRALHLFNNRLTSLPDTLGNLAQLQELTLFSNRLTTLPDSLGALAQLRELSLYNNQLTSLPDALGDLTRLQSLALYNNQLISLPVALGQLSRLQSLDLHSNQLTSLPEALHTLSYRGELEKLFLHNNEALGLPNGVLGPSSYDVEIRRTRPAPPRDILNYYFAMRGGAARALRELKVILVGRGEVGKTSLVDALQGKPFIRNRPKTDGIAITPWKIDLKDSVEDGKATAHLWDFGGQQIMHGTHQFFMTHRAIYLVVLDGRDDRTKQEAEYWLKMVRAFGGEESPVMLVLNKQGEHPYDIDREYFVTKYSIDPGHIFRTECEHAQDAGTVALCAALKAEARRLLARRELFPGAWWGLKKRLGEMRERKEDFLSESQYHEVCEKMKVPAGECTSLLRILSELGVVVSFPDDVALAHLLVLNPEWATDGVYRVLNDRELMEKDAKKRGQVTLADLRRILPADRWKGVQYHRFLLDLMEKFELCFPMEGKRDVVLVPELLPDATPSLEGWVAEECLVFLYRYPALPQGLLPRFITRTHELSEGQSRWRSGVILVREGAEALVRADHDRNELSIWVRGKLGQRRRQLLSSVREHLEIIHGRIKNLGEEALLTVPKHPKVMVPLEDVLEDEASGKRTMRLTVDGLRREVSIKDLLEGVDTSKDKTKAQLKEGSGRPGRVERPGAGPTYHAQGDIHIHHGDKHMGDHKEIHIDGAGHTFHAPVGFDQTFTNCFNTVQSLPDDKAELKAAMERLLEAVQAMERSPEVGAKAKAEMAENVEALTKEVARPEPRNKWLHLSGEGLIEAAQTCAAMAAPVVAATREVLKLFGM